MQFREPGPDPGERPLTGDRRRELLDRVYLRGDRLRRRRRLVLAASGGGSVALVAVLVLALVLPGGGQEQGLRVAGEGDETTTTVSTLPSTVFTTSTTTVPPVTVPVETTVTVPTTTVLAPPVLPTTTTIPASCRNSFDPICGPFRWDPAPHANAPFEVVVIAAQSGGDPPEIDQSTPEKKGPYEFVAGEKAWMAFRTTDPDATPSCAQIDWGDGGRWTIANGCLQEELENPVRPGCTRIAYGPWTPTEGFVQELIVGGNDEQPHTYKTPGTYTVRVRVASFVYPWHEENGFPGAGYGTCHDPYRSVADVEFTVTVKPPEPSP